MINFSEKLFAGIKYIEFRLKSKSLKTVSGIEFLSKIRIDQGNKSVFSQINAVRKELSKQNQLIGTRSFGHGSMISVREKRRICDIAKSSSINYRRGIFLHEIIKQLKPKKILELGTCMGISTLYQATACVDAEFITIEGNRQVQEIARKNIDRFKLNQVKFINDSFDNVLHECLKELKNVDYVYFDGDHKKSSTISYFNKCLEFASEKSIFVFDDIHWSKEMYAAWKQIKQHNRVKHSIDTYYQGILLFQQYSVNKNLIIKI